MIVTLLVASSGVFAQEAAPASAESLLELSLEQLLNIDVVSASRYAKSSSHIPSAVSVLSAEDIHTFGYRTLGEALNGLRGLYTSNDRNYSYLGVRGFLHPNDYNSRILLMIDGHRMNENVFDGAYIDQEFMLDIELIERIEYIPGSGATIYGANAMFGLINVITKKGKDINGTQIAGEAGSFNTYKARATFGKTLENGADVLLSASQFRSGGQKNLYFPEFDTPEQNNGVANNLDAERASRLFGKIQFEEFTLEAGYVDRFKQVPTASFGAIFNGKGFHTVDTAAYAELKYNKELSSKLSIELHGFYHTYDYYADEPYDGTSSGLPSLIINHDGASGRWWGGEAMLVSTAFDRQKWVLGLEYQYDQTQKQFNYDVNPYTLYQNSNSSGSRAEVYAQDEIQLRDNLMLSAGLRIDQHHMLKNVQINPRLGLVWSPFDTTMVKLLYSSTFRAPNAYERDLNTLGNVANPNNQEEHIKAYEGIVEWKPGSGLKLMGSLFYNDIYSLLEQPAAPSASVPNQFTNSGTYRAYGYEFETEKRWDSGCMLKASLNHTLVTNENHGGDWAVASPKNVFKLHYAEPLFGNAAKLGVENIFVDQRKTVQGGMANSYNLVNLNLSSRKFLPGLDASFGVYNLFDIHPQMPGGHGTTDIVQDILKMDGRSLRLKLEYTF